MSNMSYCRFENTSRDLADCWHHFHETDDLNGYETEGRKRIIKLALKIAERFGDEVAP